MKKTIPLRTALRLLALLLPLTLHAAVPEPDAVQQGLAIGLWEQPSGWGQGKIADLQVPLLTAQLTKRWGRPVFTVTRDGSYVLLYTNPKDAAEFVKIIGTNRKVVRVGSASGSDAYRAGSLRLNMLDQQVRFLACGNEKPEVMTEPLKLEHYSRRTGTYVLRAGGTKSQIERNLAAVSW